MPYSQLYWINDPQQEYSLEPQFTVKPAFCAQKFTVTSSSALPESHLVWDKTSQTFTFLEIVDDTTLSGETSTEYTITVLYETKDFGGNVINTVQIQFIHTIANPCTNASKIQLTAATQVSPPADSYSGITR